MKQLRTLDRFPWWHEATLALLLILMLAAMHFAMPGFLRPRGQLLLSRHLWELAILSLGMTMIIITGGIDLSVGSMMGLSAVVFGMIFEATGDVYQASAGAVAVGTVAGGVNGIMIARLRAHPLIITLATYAAFRGVAEGMSQGHSVTGFGDGFQQLARGTILGVPNPGWLFAALAAGCGVFLWKTPTGRFLYAIGHNQTASRFSGIRVDRIHFGLYTCSGFLAGLAAVIFVSRFNSARADAGAGFELDVITAVVIGGTSIFGGRGTIAGTVLGLLLIHETNQFVGRYWKISELKSIVVGLLLIASILVYRLLSRSRQS